MDLGFFNDGRTWISLLSAAVSSFSIWQTRYFWFKANRPVVFAKIVSHYAGNVAVSYNLLVSNVGNRPAVNIKLLANCSDLENVVNEGAKTELASMVYECFAEETVIPVLPPGENVFNAFGMTSKRDDQNALVYGAKIPIKIQYSDLDGQNYNTEQTLVVRISQVFANSQWDDPQQRINS